MAASKIIPEQAQVRLFGGYEESSSRSTRAIIHTSFSSLRCVWMGVSSIFIAKKFLASYISLIGIENLCVLEYDAVFLNWNEQNEREIVMIPAYSRQINHDFSRFLFLTRKMKYTDSPCSQFWVQSVVLCHSSILLYSFLKFCHIFPTCTNFFFILPSRPFKTDLC